MWTLDLLDQITQLTGNGQHVAKQQTSRHIH